MKIEISGKLKDGEYRDCRVIGYEPDYTKFSDCEWTHIYKDIPIDAIVIEWGIKNGRKWRSCRLVNGEKVPPRRMREVEVSEEWQIYKPNNLLKEIINKVKDLCTISNLIKRRKK